MYSCLIIATADTRRAPAVIDLLNDRQIGKKGLHMSIMKISE